MNKPKIRLIVAAIAALVAEVFVPSFSGIAHAAPPQFVQAFVRPDRHKALTATGLTICATPTVATDTVTEDQVVLVIPVDSGATDFALNATPANWIVDTTGIPTTGTAWPGIDDATSVTGHTITFPSGDLSSGTQYCFNITGTNTLTNGSAIGSTGITGGTLYAQDSAGPTISNQTNWAYTITTDDSIVVSAIVPPNFTIQLSAFVDTFTGNLDPLNVVSTNGVTATVTTNAVGGWIAWAKDQYAGLHSTTASYTIDSGLYDPYPGTQTKSVGDPAFDIASGPGKEGYVMDVDMTTDASGGCTPAIDAAYNYTGATVGGGVLSNTSYQPIASCTGAAPATSDGDVITMIERAAIRGGTPAGSDYTDVITVVGAGNF